VVIMNRVGLAIATANARAEVKKAAHYVTSVPGGEGAVREIVELLLKAQNRWGEILRHYEIPEGGGADPNRANCGVRAGRRCPCISVEESTS